MFLIDKPYVSDFLVKTIKDQHFRVISTSEARELIADNSLNWVSEEDAVRYFKKNPETPIYTNSENSIAWINRHLSFTKLPDRINSFKDKIKFREIIKELYPDFVFKAVNPAEITEFTPRETDFPFVIKPSLGFFSLGVHIVRNKAEWESVKKMLNPEALQSLYPEEVLNASTFIMEEYIEGEEYAVDAYYNENGEVVILNILHHKFSSGTDISDRVYTTSQEVFRNLMDDIAGFLKIIGEKTGLRNFPLHVEIRIDKAGRISPIEVNPLRFGGWCTTADLSWYAFGINSYAYFIRQEKPDWEQILKKTGTKMYSIIVLNNNSGFSADEVVHFDYELLKADFENVLEIRKTDITKYPLFGFVFTETGAGNEEELHRILNSDLKKYIRTK